MFKILSAARRQQSFLPPPPLHLTPRGNHFELFRLFCYLPHIINSILLQLFTG